jgi:hypothetical protein
MFLRNLKIAAFAGLAMLSCTNGHADETRQFPTLKLVKDCGDCNVDPTVPDLIAQAYSSKVKDLGGSIDPAEEVKVTIKQYVERAPAQRLLMGVFSGSDLIVADVEFRGVKYSARQGTRSSYFGMDWVAPRVGRMVGSFADAVFKQTDKGGKLKVDEKAEEKEALSTP